MAAACVQSGRGRQHRPSTTQTRKESHINIMAPRRGTEGARDFNDLDKSWTLKTSRRISWDCAGSVPRLATGRKVAL